MLSDQFEWLEADGLGGFASGTMSGVRTRRYHALLLPAMSPPTGRVVLVSGFDAWVETQAGAAPISSQRYTPDVIHPDNGRTPEGFAADPWPTWVFRLKDGTRIEQQLFVPHGAPLVVLCWRRLEGSGPATLSVRPFLAGRDFHALQRENVEFSFQPRIAGERVTWRPYECVPAIVSLSNGAYTHEPYWYRSFLYTQERARGMDCIEDLASPGCLRFDLAEGPAVWLLAAGESGAAAFGSGTALQAHRQLSEREARRRSGFADALQRAADAYIVQRGSGRTILAGYPWFADIGRHTFSALRGLCIATGRLDLAKQVLLEWAASLSEGMLPNRFREAHEGAEYNSVDASLWFVVAVQDLLRAAESNGDPLNRSERQILLDAVDAILTSYSAGTRFGIRVDKDGLLACGEPGTQLTWMDAKVGNWVVTPRVGKPVEVQALWLAALDFAGGFSERWRKEYLHGVASFRRRFWNQADRCLFDVVDCDHKRSSADRTFRANQIYAVGGVPTMLLELEPARAVVDAVERRLLTPVGLRTLAPGEGGYAPRCEGDVRQRDGAAHQGTVWPHLLGPFVEAWVRVRGDTAAARREAAERFLPPLMAQLKQAGLGHLSEQADGDAPHNPRGCPFFAPAMGELLRLKLSVLRVRKEPGRKGAARPIARP